jgi:3-hydroxyisobutyrate dehydrogenase-like beta-hydroxyacid dehydrogenase
VVVGIVSPGAMGSGLARALVAGGTRVVATVDGRSARTARLAGASGAELLPALEDVVRAADVVLSIVPPAEARTVANAIAGAARRTEVGPLVADLNAIAPSTARAIETELAAAGLTLVDGSISGPPPREGVETRVYVSGRRATEIASLAGAGIAWRVVGGEVGAASAVKMSTASVYKGTSALLVHALAAAHRNGVLEPVLDDLLRSVPELVDDASRLLQSAAAKAGRYVGEMEEIADAQGTVGLTPGLFEAMADVYRALAESPLAARAPEEADGDLPLEAVLDEL